MEAVTKAPQSVRRSSKERLGARMPSFRSKSSSTYMDRPPAGKNSRKGWKPVFDNETRLYFTYIRYSWCRPICMEYTVLVDDNDVILHAADGKKLLLNRETVARRLGMRQPHRPTIGSKNRNASRFCAAGNQRPRHSPRMTHFCSFRLTSTLRRGQVVLSRATLYPCPASGDFIHAEGVRVAFHHPRRRRVRISICRRTSVRR